VPEVILELRDLHKLYGLGSARVEVLKGIDFVLERGEMAGIVGASGSGKTTLLNILGCLDQPTKGSYFLGGEDVSRMSDDQLSDVRSRSIGFVFQSFNLIPQLTVVENVEVPLFYMRWPRRERRAKCEELLRAVGLGHRLTHFPTQLSGGEQQRVAIARALVNDPVLVLADEPTGNLDTKSGADVLALFDDLHREGRTILMVTHNAEIAARLPRIVEMRDGLLEARAALAASAEGRP